MVTATTAAATATSPFASNPGASILNTLSAGSGIDTAALVTSLAAASRASADFALQRRTQSNGAQVSALAQVRAGLDGFVAALDALSADTTLGAQPASTDTSIVSVAFDPAAHNAQPFGATITVNQLASAQTIVSPRIASATTPVGQGTLTLTLGTLTASAGTPTGFTAGTQPPLTITIGPGNDSLAGVRDAINKAQTGVTASILNDGQGARLVLKGPTGSASGFTLTSTDAPSNPDSASLSALAFAPGQTGSALASEAVNAKFTIDGVAVERSTNRVADAVAGYTFTLTAAQPSIPVSVSSARDPALLKAAVKVFVSAYNSITALLNTDTAAGNATGSAGPLYGQSIIQSLRSQLSGLTSRVGGGTSLAALGVQTGRDGSLTIDGAALTAATAADTGQIQQLFAGPPPAAAGTPSADTGINGTIKALRNALTGTQGGFTTYAARLRSDQTTITADTAALDTRITAYSNRLSAQFAAMNTAVAAYKSTSSFLTQQINAWTNTRNGSSAVTA